jgi:hypothetical protein
LETLLPWTRGYIQNGQTWERERLDKLIRRKKSIFFFSFGTSERPRGSEDADDDIIMRCLETDRVMRGGALWPRLIWAEAGPGLAPMCEMGCLLLDKRAFIETDIKRRHYLEGFCSAQRKPKGCAVDEGGMMKEEASFFSLCETGLRPRLRSLLVEMQDWGTNRSEAN